MYVQTCAGGYPNPLKAGRYEVLGFRVTVKTPASASQIQLWDDSNIKDTDRVGYVKDIDADLKTMIANIKGLANSDANLEVLFPEPLKLRRGLSGAFTNIVPGSFFLYVK